MNTWSLLSHPKVTSPSPVYGLAFEPLCYNRYVTHNIHMRKDTVIQPFIFLDIAQVKPIRE